MKFSANHGLLLASLIQASCTGILGEQPEDAGSGGPSADGSMTGDGDGVGDGDSGGDGDVSPLGGELPGAALALRRLTRSQYRNVLTDALGESLSDDVDLESDYYDEGFSSVGARAVSVSRLGVSKYETAAISLASAAGTPARYEQLSGCGASDLSAACWTTLVQKLGTDLFRRPPTDAEVARYVALAAAASAVSPELVDVFPTVLTGLFLSPHFLYQHDEAVTDVATRTRVLTPVALASRMALLLWDSGPDDELLAGATSGALATPEQIAAQVDRMLLDKARVSRGIRAFAEGYLSLHRLEQSTKDPEDFSEFTPALMGSMREATLLSVTDVALDRDVPFPELLTQTTNFVDGPLAAHTGAVAPAAGFARFDFGSNSRRGGLLTEPAILAITSRSFDTSPTLRGIFVRGLLCEEVPPPPANVNTALPEPTAPATRREEFEMHMSAPACNGCHAQMDPPGFALEYFDPTGKSRELDSGLPIDGAGTMEGVAFDGPRELAQVLANHPGFGECLTEKLFVHALGRSLGSAPSAALTPYVESLSEGGSHLLPLLREVVLSKDFQAATSLD